jgi:hypothetical protein
MIRMFELLIGHKMARPPSDDTLPARSIHRRTIHPWRLIMERIDRLIRPDLACALAIAALILLAGARLDDGKTKVIAAPDAKNHIGERCTVEMTVRASKNAAPRKEYYLDSEEDFRDEKNFAVVISYDHGDLFKKAGIENPAEYYMDKKLRVTGKVIDENDQTRIRVENPDQIKIVDDKK